jgi:hypothetical protein
MALTTVVTNKFFDRLYPLLRELDHDSRTGPLAVAMLIPYSGDEFRSLVLSSLALDALGFAEATSLVLQKLRAGLGKDSFKIDGVSILRTHDFAVRMVSESYDVPEIGSAHQAMGDPVFSLGLANPVIFLARPVPVAA